MPQLCTDFVPWWKASDFIRTLMPEWIIMKFIMCMNFINDVANCTDFVPWWRVSDFIRTLLPEWIIMKCAVTFHNQSNPMTSCQVSCFTCQAIIVIIMKCDVTFHNLGDSMTSCQVSCFTCQAIIVITKSGGSKLLWQ